MIYDIIAGIFGAMIVAAGFIAAYQAGLADGKRQAMNYDPEEIIFDHTHHGLQNPDHMVK